MHSSIKNFSRDEQGQDLVEYTLLMAFLVLGSAAIFVASGGDVKGIWNTVQTRLTAANTSVS